LRADALRIRAGLAASQGDPAAGDAYDKATQALRQVGSPYHLAVGLLDQAEHLTATGDPETATALTVEAASIAVTLNATPLIDRADHLTSTAGKDADRTAVKR
ncbi:MAG: hypothetical protein M3Z50_01180, partial [Actinomycetota bacterium]|nr:hypothetical protein [Actinomycetota bacterium]